MISSVEDNSEVFEFSIWTKQTFAVQRQQLEQSLKYVYSEQ